MPQKTSIHIERPEPSPQFLHARHIAGACLQDRFSSNENSRPEKLDCRWIKADLTHPSFDHLTFSHGNQIFSVLVELVTKNTSLLPQHERERCLIESEKNNLIPCVFQVDAESMKPITTGWNLIDLRDHKHITPDQFATHARVPMSEWELHNFAIQIVRQEIEKEGTQTVLSYCDVPGVDPQIWLEDSTRKRSWVIVRHCKSPEEIKFQKWIGMEQSNPQLLPYSGYFAAIVAAPSTAAQENHKDATITHPKTESSDQTLYRGDRFEVECEGLQKVYNTPDY